MLLSAGGGLQQASAKSRQSLPITAEDVDLPPSAPQLLRVVGATGTSLTLAWSASSDDGGVTGYEVRRADARGVARVTGTTHVLTDLACGRTYDVSVVAYDAVGNRSQAALLSAPTAPCRDAAAPSSPSSLRMTYRTPTSISLSWRAADDNDRVTRYGVYVDAVLVGDATSEAYTFADLRCGRNYTLAVDAVDATGNRSAPATTMIATRACPDGTSPTSPAVIVNGSTTTSVSLGWRSATDNIGVAGYELWVQDRMVGRLNARKRSYVFGGLDCGSTYVTGVIAYDASGNRSSGTTLTTATSSCASTTPPPTGDTTPPSAPATLTASSSAPTAITLAWPAATDNIGVTEYAVYVGSTRVGSTGTTSYVVSGLTCGTSYQVSVDAADAAGNRSAKTSASLATASCGDTAPPSTPTGLQLMVANETSVTVAWSPASDNVAVTGYGVYLSNLLVNSPTSPSVTLTGLTCGTPYFVEVDAKDAAGNRSGKASLWVNTKACPDAIAPSAPSGLTVPTKTQTSLTLQWTASTDNVAVTGYSLRRNSTVTGNVTTTSGIVLRAHLRDRLHARRDGLRRGGQPLRRRRRRRPRRRPARRATRRPRRRRRVSLSPGTTHDLDHPRLERVDGQRRRHGLRRLQRRRPRRDDRLEDVHRVGPHVRHVVRARSRCVRRREQPVGHRVAERLDGGLRVVAPARKRDRAGAVLAGRVRRRGARVDAHGRRREPRVARAHRIEGDHVPRSGTGRSWRRCRATRRTSRSTTSTSTPAARTAIPPPSYAARTSSGGSVDVRGSWAALQTYGAATGFRWLGGSLVAPGQRNCSTGDGQPVWLGADNATIDGVTFGVFDSGDCGSQGAFHMEAVRVQGASDISLLNVTFSQGSDTGSGHVFLTTTSPSDSQPRRFRVENTVFPPLVGSYAIQIHTNVTSYDRYVYRNNRFDQGILDPAPYVGLIACGSTGAVPTSWKAAC